MTDYYDTLEYELGDRASEELFSEELASLYTKSTDRAWAIIVLCYRRVREYIPEQAWEWYPNLDKDGMWAGRN
jgi:hypothetical protein